MEIERATMELPDTKTLRLKWPEDYAVDFLTGQFITVYWPHKQKYKRAYSLSSSALDRGHFEITIKRDGKMATQSTAGIDHAAATEIFSCRLSDILGSPRELWESCESCERAVREL